MIEQGYKEWNNGDVWSWPSFRPFSAFLPHCMDKNSRSLLLHPPFIYCLN